MHKRKTIKYFEEKLNKYKLNLKEINFRIRKIKREILHNSDTLTENRKTRLERNYSRLLELKQKLEQKIIAATEECNKKWLNRNKRTSLVKSNFDKTNIIKEDISIKYLRNHCKNILKG